tara:strand:- start:12081 stop:12353 length:273 start_codon:yes stop_codon:yes gene_type:complete
MPVTKKNSLFSDKKLTIIEIMPTNENIGAKVQAHKPIELAYAPIPPRKAKMVPKAAVIFALFVFIKLMEHKCLISLSLGKIRQNKNLINK